MKLPRLLLNGTNYHVLNGTMPCPLDDDCDSLAWDRCNMMLMPSITNSVEPEIAQSVLWVDVAPNIWKELKDQLYQGDVF
jgi:hypothetical protein